MPAVVRKQTVSLFVLVSWLQRNDEKLGKAVKAIKQQEKWGNIWTSDFCSISSFIIRLPVNCRIYEIVIPPLGGTGCPAGAFKGIGMSHSAIKSCEKTETGMRHDCTSSAAGSAGVPWCEKDVSPCSSQEQRVKGLSAPLANMEVPLICRSIQAKTRQEISIFWNTTGKKLRWDKESGAHPRFVHEVLGYLLHHEEFIAELFMTFTRYNAPHQSQLFISN